MKMKANKILLILLSVCVLGLSSCRDQFAEMNQSPSDVTTAEPSFMLTRCELSFQVNDYLYWFYNQLLYSNWSQLGASGTFSEGTFGQGTAIMTQDNYLFNMSVRENIRIGRPSATDAEVEEAARQSGCHDFILGLEKGYDTMVGSSGGHLSGGERQRISIARAMLKAAPIVILDEATAYTDPENEAVIQRSVSKLTEGKTLIVIAHRLSTVMDADKIYVIKDGQIDDAGTHKELLGRHGLYEKMWNAHMEVKDNG